jgi:biotin carboxyl carrier protein
MRYELEVAGKTLAVEVDLSGTMPRVRLDGRDVGAEVAWLGARELSLLLERRSYDIEVLANGRERMEVTVGDRRLAVDFGGRGADRAQAVRQAGRPGNVRAPMPGKVVAVLVEPGEQVEPGQGVVVVEAMKMENELTAAAAGTVRAVHVRPGQVVEGNAVLVEIGGDVVGAG